MFHMEVQADGWWCGGLSSEILCKKTFNGSEWGNFSELDRRWQHRQETEEAETSKRNLFWLYWLVLKINSLRVHSRNTLGLFSCES